MFKLFRQISKRYYVTAFGIVGLIALLASWRLHTLTVPASVSSGSARYVYVIDAGHGGEDGGAQTANGDLESGMNLAVALRLDDVMHLLGETTVMVRRTDESIYSPGAASYSDKKVSDLRNRAKLVNETPNAMLVSIHQNQFQESKYSGAQVFYNAVPPAKQLAEAMQADLSSSLDPKNTRQAKSAVDSVYLLRAIQTPGILIECGFLSNPEEAEKLKQAEYQTKLALVIAHCITGFTEEETKGDEI